MAKYIQIQIDQPCSEHWHEMKPNAAGSFCDSCKKNVTDFSAMTDNQLMEYFRNNSTGGCGRFHTDQLSKPLAIPVKRIPWVKYFFQISLPALLIGFKANAQRVIKKYQEPVTISNKVPLQPRQLKANVMVSGKISNIDGKSVAYASVTIKGSTMGVAADSNGIFRLRLTSTESILQITAAGYKEQSVTISADHTDIQLDIAMSEAILLDAVVVTSGSKYSMGAYSRVYCTYLMGKKVKKDSTVTATPTLLNMFPNPANKNGIVTIEWKDKVNTDQIVTVYNATGQKLQQQILSISMPTLRAQLKLNIDLPGNYIMQVTDSKSHKKQAISFIVE